MCVFRSWQMNCNRGATCACNVLTMSSVASLAAVTDSTRTSGTTVVNQDSEEICGITWRAHTHTHTINPNLFLTRWGNFLAWTYCSLDSPTSCLGSTRLHCDKQPLLALNCYRLINGQAQMAALMANMAAVLYLKHQQKEEVGVSDPLELLEQVQREEGEEVVLWGLDGVGL